MTTQTAAENENMFIELSVPPRTDDDPERNPHEPQAEFVFIFKLDPAAQRNLKADPIPAEDLPSWYGVDQLHIRGGCLNDSIDAAGNLTPGKRVYFTDSYAAWAVGDKWLMARKHYKDGKGYDPSADEPNFLRFRRDGIITVAATSSADGSGPDTSFSSTEIKALNIKKGLLPSKSKKSPDLLIQIPAIRYSEIEYHVLLIDRQTRFNLAADPIPERYKTNADLVSSLIARGAVWNDYWDQDGNIAPALRRFDEETENQTYQCHYREGARQNPARGIYAEQFFDVSTGRKSASCSYDEHTEHGARRQKPEKPSTGRTPKLPPYLAQYVMEDTAPVL